MIERRGFLQMLFGAPAAAALPASAFPKKLIEHVEPVPKVVDLLRADCGSVRTIVSSGWIGVSSLSSCTPQGDHWGVAQFKESK